MPLYTPHGLKIRLDPEDVAEIVKPLAACHDMNDVLLDVELWENLPEGLTALVASATAFFTRSPGLTVAGGVAGYVIGSCIRGFTYSDVLRRLIPLFLGAWLLTLLQTLAVAVYLVQQHSLATAVVLCIVNMAAHLGVFGLSEILLTPIRVPLRQALGLQPTHQEGVYVAICNRRAARYGVRLDWSRYTRLQQEKSVHNQ